MELTSLVVIWLLLAMKSNASPLQEGTQPFPAPESALGGESPSEKDYKLVSIQILHRHGARSPLLTYPNDPNPRTVWPEGLGQLSLHGRLQLWTLGKHLRNMYSDFLEFSPNEVYVNSSSTDRCLKSVLCLTASFFVPRPEWQFAPNIYWEPIPVHYVPDEQDEFLKFGKFCPAAQAARFKTLKSPAMLALIEKYKKVLDHFSDYSGFNLTDSEGMSDNLSVFDLYDTLNIEKNLGLEIPHWVTPQNLAELQKIYIEVMNIFFVGSHISVKYGIGPLIGKIFDNMDQRMSSKTEKSGSNGNYKVFIYSAHETNLMMMLKALDIYDGIIPKYSASIIFELYQKDEKFFVRILYINPKEAAEYVGPTQVLTLKDCSEFCPIEKFKAYIDKTDIVPKNYKKGCAIS